MITEKEIEQAIEECMREPVTGNKRAVLADLIIIQLSAEQVFQIFHVMHN